MGLHVYKDVINIFSLSHFSLLVVIFQCVFSV